MRLVLTMVLAVGFVASLLPFLFPGAIISMLGTFLNDVIGNGIAAVAPGLRSNVIMAGPEGTDLTLPGVLALYVPVLLLLIALGR
jgi:hypothetical protein